MFCTKCEFDNAQSARYCQNCGKKLNQKKGIRAALKGADLGGLVGHGTKRGFSCPIAK